MNLGSNLRLRAFQKLVRGVKLSTLWCVLLHVFEKLDFYHPFHMEYVC